MASKENHGENAKSLALHAYKTQTEQLKIENKKLSDENHLLRLKMAADGKKLVMIRNWITNFNELSGMLKEIAKDWEPIPPALNENNANALCPAAKSDVNLRPIVVGSLRAMFNRSKLTPLRPTTPAGILQTAMVDRLKKNIQEVNNAAPVHPLPGPSSSIADDMDMNMEIKTEVDDEDEVIVAPVAPAPKKLAKTLTVLAEPLQKVDEKMVKKRKVLEQPKVRQTRSKARANNDEEPSEKRQRSTDDYNDSRAVSRSKSDDGKIIIKRMMTKRSANH